MDIEELYESDIQSNFEQIEDNFLGQLNGEKKETIEKLLEKAKKSVGLIDRLVFDG